MITHFIICSWLCIGWAAEPYELDSAKSIIWRTASCDATNCAFALAAAANHSVEWSEIHSRVTQVGSSPSLLSIKNALSMNGLNVQIEKPNFDELVNSHRNAIVLLDDSRQSGSSFSLFVNYVDDEVAVMNGATANLGSLTKEEFLRDWTGHALFIQDDDGTSIAKSVSSLNSMGVFLFLAAAYFIFRFKP